MLDTDTIYIEKEALQYDETQQILSKLSPSNIIQIDNYKDFFCRPRQNFNIQSGFKKIILAVKHNNLIYKGATVCHNFNNENFYYCTCVINCIGNCDYCYLKGKYDSSNIVIFVNLKDYFSKIGNSNNYISISYDTDLFPLEKYCGYIKRWLDFARNNPKTKFEIRTKFKNLGIWNYEPTNNMIFGFSISPDIVISKFENNTSKLSARLDNIIAAQKNNFITRLCFDPIVYFKDWKSHYSNLIQNVFAKIDPKKIDTVSIGSFRISQYYLKKMRAHNQNNPIVNFPFSNVDGYYQYPIKIQQDMEKYIYCQIAKVVDKEKIFLWK